MKHTLAASLFAAMVLPLAAHAQTAPGTTPSSTDELNDDSNLSQINGTPVPVGTHNEYYYSFRRWNVSSNPLGWMIGSYGVSASYGITDNVALRGDMNYFRPTGGDDGFEIGVGAPIYFRRTYTGVFLEPGLIVRRFGDDGWSETTAGPQMLAGWHWIWDSGLNVAVAAGVGRNWSTDDDANHYGDDELFANGYLRFGYAF